MRALVLLLGLLLLAPPALADARQVHLSPAADGGLVVEFLSSAPLAHPRVSFTGPGGAGSIEATQVQDTAGENETLYDAEIPASATSYTVEGRTFALHARDPAKLRVVVMADMGRSADSWRMWALAAAQRPDVILLAGDISYANGNATKWDEWFAGAEPLAATVPLMTTMGNHETYCSPDGTQLEPCAKETNEYLEHFRAPGDPLAYDITLGPAHFTALDTEADYPGDPAAPRSTPDEQAQFLRDSLARAGDAWRIVFFHRALYSSNTHEADIVDARAKAAWTPVFDAQHVALALNGHAHAYERTYALSADAVATKDREAKEGTGTFYVTTGGGGRSVYPEFAPQPAWSAVRSAQFELVVLDITKDAVVGHALAEDGHSIDAFAVYRGDTPPPLAEVQESARGVAGAAPLALVGAVVAIALLRRR